MSSEVRNPLLLELLIAGTDDWVHASEIAGVVRQCGATSESVLRSVWIGVVSEAIVMGSMEPGDVDRLGFHPWNLDVGSALARIVREFDAIGFDELRPGGVMWLRNTSVGDAVAQLAIDSGWEAPD